MAYTKFSTPPAIGDTTPNAGTFSSLNDTALTASRLLASDGSKNLTSVADLTTWVAGTSNRITSTSNGSGATTIDIAATYVGQTSITTLGTIATGTWNGTTIGVGFGGTGQTSYTNGQLLIGNSTGNTLTKATLTQGSGISITNGTGSITIALDSAAAVTSITATAPLTANGLSASAQTGAVTVALSTPLALSFGGTNANLTASNGGIFYSTATAGAILAGTATANKMLLSGASGAPSWSTSTIPSSAGATANKVLLSDGTNYVLSTPTFPNASATSGKIIISDGTNWIASTPTFPNAATSTGTILRADGTNWAATTATYPNTTTINQILYSSSANTIAGITASNNGVLISGTGGIPSWLAAGSTGQVLIATTSNPPSWGTLSSLAVTSITGTANQISASASTGAVTLSFTNGISIGSYQATSPPTGGIICPGKVGIGSAGVGDEAGVVIALTVTGLTFGLEHGLVVQPTMAPSSAATDVSALFVKPFMSATSNITNAYNCRIDTGFLTPGPGTITNGYGLYVSTPAFGTKTIAIYGDNLAIGYTATTPPTNGVIVSGNTSIGTSSNTNKLDVSGALAIGTYAGVNTAPSNGLIVSGNVAIGGSSAGGYLDVQGSSSVSGALYGTLLRTNLTETGSSSGTCGVFVGGTHTVNGSGTNTVAYMQVSPTVTATTTVSAAYGINLFPGSGTGTVSAAYGLYAQNPGYGTTKTAIYTDNLSVGYTGTTPPSSGAIISGKVGIGTSSVDSSSYVEMTSSGPYTLRLAGTLSSTVNTQQASIWIRSALQPTSGNTGVSAHIFNQAFTIAPSGQTIANAAACYLAQDYEFNAGTITNAYQLLISTTASGTGTGTITNAYGAYITAPNAGTKICALYTDNLSVGYTATTPPSAGAIISGKVGIGTSAPASTTAALEVATSASNSSTFNGIVLSPTLTQTGNGQSTHIVQITGTQVVNGSGTNSGEFLRVFGQFTATTTINNAFGVHILASSGSGTINNGYGLFVENPGVGTTKTATYTENLSVGYAGVTPPTNGAIISGSVAIGTSSATTSALLTMSSTTKGFLPPAMTTTQKNAISSPASGLTVYDSTLNAVQVYNGSVWSTTGYAASSIVYLPVLSATGNAVNNGGTAGTNGWSATTNGTTVSNISSFINNAFGPNIQTTSVPTVNTYIQYNAGTGFANGIYLIRYILQSATDRAIVTVSEVTTATTIRSNYDTYSSSGASTNSIFEDQFLWTGGTGASMIIRWTGASKNASSSNYYILLANYFEIKRMG